MFPIFNKRALGAHKEKQAKQYLSNAGLVFVEQNFNCKAGEIDLIFHQPDIDMMVFVEVRYRKNDKFGGAAASITASKQLKVKKAALFYLAQRNIQPNFRFDVIAIEGDQINWIQSAFT